MTTKPKVEIPIMFCFDKNYVIPAAVTFYSLLEHADKNYHYHFYVLHSDISKLQQEKLQETIKDFGEMAELEFVDMAHRFDEIWKRIYKGGHFAKEVMYKLLIASIFPQYDKLIVTDVDVVFLGDVSKSYTELDCNDDIYIAGVRPIGKINSYMENYKEQWSDEEIQKLGHICGGYLVANLKKIREDNMEEKFINCFKENGYRLNQMEQDILNICCYPKFKYLPLSYVACSYMWDYFPNDASRKTDENYSYEQICEAMDNTIQLHYATSIKPWKNVNCTKSEEWFKYLAKTPFLAEFLDNLGRKMENTKCKAALNNTKTRGPVYRLLRYIKHNPTFMFKKDFYHRILVKIRNKIYFHSKKDILYICDNVFPSKYSGFRYEEFVSYWNKFNDVTVLTSKNQIEALEHTKNADKLINDFKKSNAKKHHSIMTFPFDDKFREQEFTMQLKNYKKKLAYVIFLNNLIDKDFSYLNLLEKYQIPFVFTLYPGGGFALDNNITDEKLQRVFNSPMFRKVIVTQKVTRDYLINNNFCNEKYIELIYGVVVPEKQLSVDTSKKIYYGKDKDTLDICFVAYKYMKEGKDKGYDLFISSAKKICQKHDNVRFHVVGNFDENDIDVSSIKDKITFYGPQKTEWFSDFYKDKDIIISPNRNNQLTTGAFDGFPTGSAIEAVLNKVMLMATDCLKQNIVFKDKEDILLIKPEVDDIVKKVEDCYKKPEKMIKIIENGYKVAQENYSYDKQISSRINIIEEELKK